MNRKVFFGSLLKSVFGAQNIMLQGIDMLECVEISKGGTALNDCSYTQKSGQKFVDIFNSIFASKKTKIFTCSKSSESFTNEAMCKKCMTAVAKNVFADDALMQIKPDYLELPVENIRHIYSEIIFRELFSLEKGTKKNGGGDFDAGLAKIRTNITSYLKHIQDNNKDDEEDKAEVPKPLSSEIQSILDNNQELFGELKIDIHDEPIADDVKDIFDRKAFWHDYEQEYIETKFKCLENAGCYNKDLSAFNDRDELNKHDFDALTDFCMNLLSCSEYYYFDFKYDDVQNYKNTAFRIYREIYGIGHREIPKEATLKWYQAHEYLLEYVVRLNDIISRKKRGKTE